MKDIETIKQSSLQHATTLFCTKWVGSSHLYKVKREMQLLSVWERVDRISERGEWK